MEQHNHTIPLRPIPLFESMLTQRTAPKEKRLPYSIGARICAHTYESAVQNALPA